MRQVQLRPTKPAPQIPKFLMERWSNFDTEGVQLAKIRIYKPQSGAPRIVVFVPPEDGSGDDGDDDIYELDMIKEKVENQIVVAGRPKTPSGTGRARTTIMTGKIKHECNLRPRMTERYERRLMERGAAANEKPMRVKRMDGARAGRGGGKMLSSGIMSAAGFADIAVSRAFLPTYILYITCPAFRFTARKEQAGKGPKRTHDAYASQPTARCALYTLPRARAMAPQALAREDAAARAVLEGGVVRDRDGTSQRGVQWHLGAHAELQRGWGGFDWFYSLLQLTVIFFPRADQGRGYVAAVCV